MGNLHGLRRSHHAGETPKATYPPSSSAPSGPQMTLDPYCHVDCSLRSLAGKAEGSGQAAVGGLNGPMPFHEPQQNNVDWCRPKSCIRVTTHHCFFDGTRHRHHRVRFAKIHLYKNYTRHWSIYAIGAGVETQVRF
ncbi:hypothetical protein Bca4012_003872 [Brassica carinata]